MSMEPNPAGADAQVAPATTPEKVTPELAASLPYDELKARMRAEARSYEEPATTDQTPADDRGEDADEGAVTPETAGTERDPQTGRFVASPSEQGQTATEVPATQAAGRRPETLEDALRVIDSLRGNLQTNINARDSAQQRLKELEAEAARQRQEVEQERLRMQHARFEDLVSRLPAEAQGPARQEYVAALKQQAVTEFAKEVQQREQALTQREQQAEFRAAKAELPALYKDIATFVADQHGIPAKELADIVDSKHIQALIDAAETPQAVQSATIAFGQLIDLEATRAAGRMAAEKAARREARSGTQVRDIPQGVTAGGAQEDVVARINGMSTDEFAVYKKRLLKAAQR